MTLMLGVVIGVVAAVLYLGRSVPVDRLPAATTPAAAPVAASPPPAQQVPLPASALPEVQPPAPVSPEATSVPAEVKVATQPLLMPVAGVSAKELTDTYNQSRGTERKHEALDILAPKGTPVFAVADGKIVKLFNSKPGGLTVYQFDVAEKYSYYYAHLDRYAPNLKEGQPIRRGEMIGYVGTTGNADPATPHLHFAVFELDAKKNWWEGAPVNPYPLLTAQ
ncbi:M23 family metallopeptidase [Massilia endophytica]|uniref:M23 family metallopeptidase n=1 Tax=Massilia endophytica TaxID=2899220 RepID=UPI001E5B3748|nr:M23 family metallopeptidase [Massilia endophytica]UGQ48041.1 M23 family metallopeptidase [Massilia endophytica]